jgi:RNA polymerase sigma-70 factor, ECF subfamily
MTPEFRDTERKLIEECLQGNHAAFEQIYKNLADKMYTVSIRYTQNDDDAKDALQEAFIRIYNKLSSFRFGGSFEGWCRRIVVNCSIELIRKRNRNQSDDLETTNPVSPEMGSLEKLNYNDLLSAIRTLPDGYRAVFNMFAIEGYSHKEISEAMGISESTSKTQLFKARLALQNKVKNHQL